MISRTLGNGSCITSSFIVPGKYKERILCCSLCQLPKLQCAWLPTKFCRSNYSQILKVTPFSLDIWPAQHLPRIQSETLQPQIILWCAKECFGQGLSLWSRKIRWKRLIKLGNDFWWAVFGFYRLNLFEKYDRGRRQDKENGKRFFLF